jgi:hypothetical protein
MSWRDERVSCCGRRRADAMVGVRCICAVEVGVGRRIYCDATMHSVRSRM